ncbi:MAG TPA: response regulator [Longimicrobiales bacterium]|nr:response regulator [Longimicrobiales bacterium]
MTSDVDPGADGLAGSTGSNGEARRQLVLIVEDNDADRDFCGGLLWYDGYDVIHAPDGESAIEKAVEAGPDLILLDIRLPGARSGLDVARALREQGVQPSIIALSALSRDEVGAAAAEAGVSVFLESPSIRSR